MPVWPAIVLAVRKSKRWLQTINFRERYTECVSFLFDKMYNKMYNCSK